MLSSTSRSVSVLNSFITASSAVFLIIGIIFSLFTLHFSASLAIVASLFLAYLLIYRASRSRLYQYGKQELALNKQSLTLIREAVESSKELIIYDLVSPMAKALISVDKQYRNYQAKSMFLTGLPRIFIEMTFLIIIITSFSLLTSSTGSLDFSLLSFFAFHFCVYYHHFKPCTVH